MRHSNDSCLALHPTAPLATSPPLGTLPYPYLLLSFLTCRACATPPGPSLRGLTCHDKFEESQDDRNPGSVCVRCKACVLEDLGSVVKHAGLACDLLEEHQAAAHQQGADVTLAEERPQPPCIKTIVNNSNDNHRFASQS